MNSVQEVIQASEQSYVFEDIRNFNYASNEKNLRSKLVKGAKRSPFEVVQNSTSMNMIFSLGSWNHTVIPVVKHWSSIKGRLIKIEDNEIKVVDVKTGKDMSVKNIDSLITFYLNNERVVLHCYNTTQLILVSGFGYEQAVCYRRAGRKKLVHLFLKPFLNKKFV